MLVWVGSSLQEDVLLRAEGLCIGPSLNCEDTLLMRDVCDGWNTSDRSPRSDVCTAMRCRQRSYQENGQTLVLSLNTLSGATHKALLKSKMINRTNYSIKALVIMLRIL